MAENAAIVLDDVSKSLGRVSAVANVTLEIAVGETVGLVGPNGAGKSTLMKLIARGLRSTSGSVMLLSPEPRITRSADGALAPWPRY